MEAIHFKGSNLVLAKDQPQYKQLPVCYQGGREQAMTFCMKLTLRERIRLLFRGRIFVTQLTFGQSFHPQDVSLDWKEPVCVNCGSVMSAHRSATNFTCPAKLN